MERRLLRNLPVAAAALLLAAGCGGDDAGESSTEPSSVTGSQRIEACLTQQPDATRAECEEWEQAGELANDGTHKDHASAAG